MSTDKYDIAILGSGPGGEAAARQAALRGARACVIEAGKLGGACLNVGCIPTKAMLHASDVFWQMRQAASLGLVCREPAFDAPAVMKRVADVVATVRKGLAGRYSTGSIDIIAGRGRFVAPLRLLVELDGGGRREISASSVIVATGSSPVRPPAFPWGSSRVLTTDQAATAAALPASIIIVGGGVIGCEFATFYSELGIATTVVEMLPRLSPTLDEEASALVQRSLRRRGADIRLAGHIVSMTAGDEGVAAETEDGSRIGAECALVAVGRRANVDGIGLGAAGVRTDAGLIPVDDRCRTNVSCVYAVGDVAERRQYAHLAARMGVVAAENATGHDLADDRSVVPVVQFTHPEVAAVGTSEADARRACPAARAASVQYQAASVAWAYGQRDGLVKLIADGQTGRLLGALVVGCRAGEVVQELALAMRHGLTVAQIAETIHAHPTFAEGVSMAAEKWLAEGPAVAR